MNKREIDAKTAALYRKAGEYTLKKFGVHHLSKSSADGLLDCINKFHFKSQYVSAKPSLVLGSICHGVLEQAADVLAPFTDGLDINNLDIDKTIAEFKTFRDEKFEEMDLEQMFLTSMDKELDDLASNKLEVLYQDGQDLVSFTDEIHAVIETLSKSFNKAQLKDILDGPIIGSELPVIYLAGEQRIPYLGYIDLLKVGEDGHLRIVDLKTTFSVNQNVWKSPMVKFQLWLYGNALKQMGIVSYLPNGEIDKLTIDLGTRRKIKPTNYRVTLEKGAVYQLQRYDKAFANVIDYAEKLIENNIEIYARGQYGCAGCDYKNVCPNKVLSDDWVFDREVQDGENE